LSHRRFWFTVEPVLIGRDSECQRLEGLLERAQLGRRGALALRGEAGIGKTALLGHAIDRADGMTVVRAVGVESEAELEFSALLEVCRPLLGHVGEIPERQAAALRAALGLGPAGDHDRFAIGAATLSLLAAAAESNPLLVVVDDAHWLDRSSQDAILFATKRLDADRVLLLFAARDGEEREFEAPGVETISLGGLPRDATAALLRKGRGVDVAPEIVERLHRATGGNPLALIELPPLLTADQLAGAAPLAQPLPAGRSIERAFARRAEALPAQSRRALLVAAAAGSSSIEPIRAALASLGIDESALEMPEDAGLIRLAEGRVSFRHSLVRSGVYHSATPSERRAAHRALADAMQDASEGEERAWHLAAATLGADEEVAAALEQAAGTARRRAGFAAAAAGLERAARLTPDEQPRLRRLCQAADDCWRAGRGGHALMLVNEALDHCNDPRQRADMLHLLGRIQHFGGPVVPAHELLLSAARLVEDSDAEKAVAILSDAFEACVYAGEVGGMLEAGRRARDLAPRDGGPTDFLAEMTLAEALFFNGRSAEGVPIFERGLTLFDANPALMGDPLLVTRAAIAYEWLERSHEGRETILMALQLARDQGATAALPYALIMTSMNARQLGLWQEALAAAGESETLARETGQITLLGETLGELAMIEAGHGHEDDCRRHAAEAMALAEGLGLGLTRERASYAIGLLELGLGRLDEAAEALAGSVERLEQMGIHMMDSPAATDLVEALARLGRLDEARAALAFIHPEASPGVYEALAARCHGIVADRDDFERHFARSLELHPEGSHVFQRARTRLCLGERLRRAGRRVEARDELRAALETFERCGTQPWAERARMELRASGEKLRRRDPSEAEELTPQELQIALQVAEGRSNKEVGAALFLSHKTVEFHLGRIYRKLDIHSRAELIRQFAAQPAMA
jgi:DNA-binding NarL/FixJ family response regulator